MSHLNYNHLYYFWMVCRHGSVTKAADALFLTPQTVTGQIRTFEESLGGKLTRREGRSIVPTELGQLIFKYADKMFGLSYEMQDILHYSQRENLLFDVGVADALSKRLVSDILAHAVPDDGNIHLRCYESTHAMLLDQLAQHKLDIILSDCPVDSTQISGLFSKKLGECEMAFFSYGRKGEPSLTELVKQSRFLVPGSRTAMGRRIMQWFDSQGIQPNVLGEFDDVALMQAFARIHPDTVFIAPSVYSDNYHDPLTLHWLGDIADLKEEYYVIFAERMIQHPAVKMICETQFYHLFIR